MTIYTRPDELVFADNAKAGEVAAFPDIRRGWGLTAEQTDLEPPMEWMNDLFLRQDKAIRYFMQRSVAEWSATEDYPTHALVQFEGLFYQALQANKGKSPTTSNENWVSFDKKYALSENLGTASERNIGNGVNQVPDMSFFGVIKDSSGVGYQKLPSGVIIQWGYQSCAEKTTTRATFPIAFPTACVRVVSTGFNIGGSVHAIVTNNGADRSGYYFNAFYGLSGAVPVIATTNQVISHYIAIGY